MKRWTRVACLAGVMLFALALVARGSWSAAGQGGAGDGTAPELEGTWRTTVAIHALPGGDPPPVEGVLHTFARGGVVMITVPFAGQSAAQGTWTRLGPRRFGFTAEMYWVDPTTGQMGKTKVKEVIEVSEKGDEYHSVKSSAVDIYPDGLTVPYCANTHGKRMTVERPDPCQ